MNRIRVKREAKRSPIVKRVSFRKRQRESRRSPA